MSPTVFLSIMVIITAGAAGWGIWTNARRRLALRRLATAWQMHYTHTDRFRLAQRVAPRLSVPGAAAVHVKDVIYGVEADGSRYIFATEFTTGAVGAHSRREIVAAFSEPREHESGAPVELITAPQELPTIEQYVHLHARSAAASNVLDESAPVAADARGHRLA